MLKSEDADSLCRLNNPGTHPIIAEKGGTVRKIIFYPEKFIVLNEEFGETRGE